MAYCIRPDANLCNTGKAGCIVLTKMLNRVMILCSTECFDTHSFDTHGTFIYVKCFSGERKKKQQHTFGVGVSSCNISLHASIFMAKI